MIGIYSIGGNIMNKKKKTIIISAISIIACVLIIGHTYVSYIRSTAMDKFKQEFHAELKNIQKSSDLEKLSNDNWEDYYYFVRVLSDEKIIGFQEQNEMLAFFDGYEEYSNFNILKENYVDKNNIR